MLLNEDYIISKFYQYAGYPKYNRLSKAYNGGCPTCREGKSWGKKRRLYYVIKNNLIFCHNCGLSVRPVKWIMQVSGMNYVDVLKESEYIKVDSSEALPEFQVEKKQEELLPQDSINLSDCTQVAFYKDNKIVQKALEVIDKRRLDKAINKPKEFWLSLTDKIHRDRLIIPFYDLNNKIVHYQTRTIVEKKNWNAPKYLSKNNSEKTLFGVNNVSDKSKFIFVTEGPLDSCFISNGVAVAGINEGRGDSLTDKQKEQLKSFPSHELVWVLDNQLKDQASRKKTSMLIKQDFKVFIWPRALKKFKDINEVCTEYGLNSISEKFILSNTYSGLKAKMLLSQN